MKPPVESYLILYNITKDANLGFLFRTANAFGVTELILVGKRNFNVGGACGLIRSIRKRHFHTISHACAYLRERDVLICGVEIRDDALAIGSCKFDRSTAFMLGNEGVGLTDSQQAECDQFVYVPQYGIAECINVNVAAGIVLHHFASQAGWRESPRSGQRFGTPRPVTPGSDVFPPHKMPRHPISSIGKGTKGKAR